MMLSKEDKIRALKKQIAMLENTPALPDKTVFANRLARALKEQNLMQTDLADILSLSPSAISYYLSGNFLPNAFTAVRIADALGMDIHELLGFTDGKEGNT